MTPTTSILPSRRFGAVAIALHWATVVLIVGLFASAWSIGLAGDGDQAALLLTVHRSLGATTGLLAIVRLGWRLGFAAAPPLPATMSRPQQWMAKASEYGLYALLLFQPLTGLAQTLLRGRPFQLFAWTAPRLMARDKGLAALFHQVHAISALALLGLIGLHVAAALFHRFWLKDQVLQSMLPWPPAPKMISRSRE